MIINTPHMTVIGTVALVATASCCAVAAWRARRDRRPRDIIRIWSLLAAAAIAFACYRAGGVEYALADDLRRAARAAELYDGRRFGQAIATSIAVVLMLVISIAVIRRGTWPIDVRVALLAGQGYLALSLIRIVSLHLTDAVLYHRLGPIRMNWVVEAALLGGIAVGALSSLRRNAVGRSSADPYRHSR